MLLCSSRPDGGFGPYYDNNGLHVLSTCFEDVLLEPLGSFIFVAFTLVLLAVNWSRHSPSHDAAINIEALPLSSDPASERPNSAQNIPKLRDNNQQATIRRSLPPGGMHSSRKWRKSRLTCLILSTFFVVALLGMHALEIARLAANMQGIGLLPVIFVPLVLVLASLYVPTPAWSRGGWSRPARPHGLVWVGGVALWSIWMVVTTGVKMWSLSAVYNKIGIKAYDGENSQYPYSDKLIDNIVICAVYFCFLLCYAPSIHLSYIQYSWNWF